MVPGKDPHYRHKQLQLLRYRCAILKKANAKANNFRGLGRTMPESSVGG